MRFDDRLITVLHQPAAERHDMAVRWRQLVDLVARSGSNAESPAVAEALEAIRTDAPNVDEGLRAAAARAVAALPLPLALLEYFASDRLAVSAPVLAAATLDKGQWQALLTAADDETARFIETLHPEQRRDENSKPDAPVPAVPQTQTGQRLQSSSLHEVVERIERRRRTRAAMQRASSVAGAEAASSLFRWECGPNGDISWVEGAPRGAVIGRSLARSLGEELDPSIVRAFAMRAPFRDARLSIGGDASVAGEWKISGVPAFEPTDGRFAGYRGVALREQSNGEADAPPGLLADPDSVRELVHEIKTPLNAIIGFAEIIETQLLGPTEPSYRERAGEVVGQARLLLTAIDDLDFAAKVHSDASPAQQRVNLGELVERMAPALRAYASDRGVSLDASRALGETTASTEPELADRLIFRTCTALIDLAQPGERLRFTLEPAGERLRVSVSRPAALVGLGEEALLSGEEDVERAFPIRLARGLAQVAGAELTAPPEAIALLFPRV